MLRRPVLAVAGDAHEEVALQLAVAPRVDASVDAPVHDGLYARPSTENCSFEKNAENKFANDGSKQLEKTKGKGAERLETWFQWIVFRKIKVTHR